MNLAQVVLTGMTIVLGIAWLYFSVVDLISIIKGKDGGHSITLLNIIMLACGLFILLCLEIGKLISF